MKYYFAPSLMCMNLMELKSQLETLNARADFYHVDIMDGHFVKNLTLSPMFIEQIKDCATLPIDAHLMLENPNDFIDMLIQAGSDFISLQAETITRDAFRTISRIHGKGCKAGIVLSPTTPLSHIEPYIDQIDKLTIMTVDPGFAGQKFIYSMLNKITEAKELKERKGHSYLIEIDGSCNERTYSKLVQAGAEVFILGTTGLFGLDPDLEKAWDKMIAIFDKCV